MRYHLYQTFFGKIVKIKEMSFLSTRGMGLMFGNCICLFLWGRDESDIISREKEFTAVSAAKQFALESSQERHTQLIEGSEGL